MKNSIKKNVVGLLTILTLVIAIFPIFTAVPAFASNDTKIHTTTECKYERVPVYGPWCHGYQMIIGYKNVCTVHNH